VVLKLGLGTPGNINLGVEVQATQNFALEVGAAAGLGANALEAGLRWRPDATCWGAAAPTSSPWASARWATRSPAATASGT
jgi:hypothetical protein